MSLLLSLLACALLQCAGDMAPMIEKEKAEKTKFWEHFHTTRYDDVASRRSQLAHNATCVGGRAAGVYACDRVDLLGFLSLEAMGCGAFNNEQAWAGFANDIWGWTSPAGREIAIVGCSVGTAFVDVTDPLLPRQVGFLRATDTFSYWRDMKVYGDYVYIGSESRRHGVQVLHLGAVGEDAAGNSSGVGYAATHVYYGVGSSHNLFVHEESGYLYVLGSNECGGGLHVADLQSSPAEPTFVTCYGGVGYVHDIHCVMYRGPDIRYTGREICVTFTGVNIRILDVTDKCGIVVVATATYAGRSFVHQGWWTADHRYFVMGDENDELDYGMNMRSLLWDAADLTSLSVAHEYMSATGSVDHNQYIHAGLVWQSNYCSGLRVLNVSAGRLSPAGHFDVSFSCPSSNPWLGSWSNYPFFSSGNIAVASIEMGMFILKPQFQTVAPPAPSGATSSPTAAVPPPRPQCAPHPTSLSSLYSPRPSGVPSVVPTLAPPSSGGLQLSTAALTAIAGGSFFVLVCVGGAIYDKVMAVGGVATELQAGAVVPEIGTTADHPGVSTKTTV